jgi:hypothetical protein
MEAIMNLKSLMTVTVMGLLLTTACSTQEGGGTAAGTGGTNGQQSTPIAATPTANWQTVTSQTDAAVSGGTYNQYPLVHIDAPSQTLVIYIPMLPLTLGSFTPILPTAVPSMPGVTVGPVTMPGGGIGWGISVPLKYVLKGAAMAPLTMTLPNGSPLPYFPAAETHGVSLTFPNHPSYHLTLYVALKAVAVFVEIPDQNIPLGFGYNLVNKQKTRNIGYFAILPNQGAFNGGVYVSAQLPTDISLLLNSLVTF